jgi:outer membrane protein TolC
LLLEEQETVERIRLNSLLGRAPETAVGPLTLPLVLPLAHSLEEILIYAGQGNAEIALARAAREKAEGEITSIRYRNLPELNLGVFVETIEEGAPGVMDAQTGTKAVGVTVGLTLPIWPAKIAGRSAVARAAAEQAAAELAARINETGAAVSRQYFRLRNAERLISLYAEELIPRAAKDVETAETWFRNGRSSLSDLTETHSVWYNFQLALARAKADHGQYLAALEGLTGRSLTGAAASADAPEEKMP